MSSIKSSIADIQEYKNIFLGDPRCCDKASTTQTRVQGNGKEMTPGLLEEQSPNSSQECGPENRGALPF